ncbi:hypothetical protein D1007_51064 [Hordeum vulgare]|nr:hypothetical protein D1007_51064 [Hordeum vulgare]
MLSWEWLFMDPTDVHNSRNFNVKIGVKLLYIMVMCQGILYFVACILESLSFLFRRSLALSCGLVDKSGMESIDLYYEQAYVTFLQESLLDTTEKMGLVTFAVDILNHDATQEKKRVAVRILDSFVQKNKTSNSNDTQLVSLITTTTHAVATLISMLGWTVAEDADIRVFAAKITAHLSPHLLIIGIPGTMQKVSSLLDAQDQLITQEISTQIVDGNGGNANDQQITNGSRSPVLDGNRRNIGRQQTRTRNGSSYSPVDIERGNVSAVPGHSRTCKVLLFLMEGIYRFWEHIEKLSSIPHKKSEDNDSLPLPGLQILEGLAHDLYNCAEISRAMELLPKIIGFLNCITGTRVVQRDDITTSPLKLVVKLASIKGQIGITLRQELCDNPFLIGNLAEILELGSNPGYLEQSKFAMDIIEKLAIDKKTRLRTGTVQVIIDKLLQEFIGEDESSKPLQAEAGEALATLSHDSPGNCTAMLDKISYELIEDLAGKLQRGQHVYAAASLLESLCKNSRQLVLSHQDINERLSSTLTVVLEGIKNAEGKQMEALIGLASQICSIMFGNIAHVLDSFPVDVVFVDKLVGELNARKKASPGEFPEMRRLLVQLTTSIVESRPRYALIFREHGMVEALSKVEQYMGFGVTQPHPPPCPPQAAAAAAGAPPRPAPPAAPRRSPTRTTTSQHRPPPSAAAPPFSLPPRSPLAAIADPGRNPRSAPGTPKSLASTPKACAAASGVRDRSSSIGGPAKRVFDLRDLAATEVPVEVPHFELDEDPAFWMDRNVQGDPGVSGDAGDVSEGKGRRTRSPPDLGIPATSVSSAGKSHWLQISPDEEGHRRIK